jgi:hypothetical protein
MLLIGFLFDQSGFFDSQHSRFASIELDADRAVELLLLEVVKQTWNIKYADWRTHFGFTPLSFVAGA